MALSFNQATEAFNVVVDLCGANPDLHSDAVNYFTRDNGVGFWEYRFSGKLGFGGKLVFSDDRLYVRCYPEDRTEERDRIIQEANARLSEILNGS